MDTNTITDALQNTDNWITFKDQLSERICSMEPDAQYQIFIFLKGQADQFMRADINRCLEICQCMDDLATLTGDPRHAALGLLARANAYSIGLARYQEGVELYDQAAVNYEAQGLLVEQARSKIGKIYALMNLGRYDEAFRDGLWARDVMRENGEMFLEAKLSVNLAILHGRLGQDIEALAMFDQAQEVYAQLGPEVESLRLRVELNRAVVLRNLGRFQESTRASQHAIDKHFHLGQKVAAARSQQNLAVTYFVMGRFNESLALLEEARRMFEQDGRTRDTMLAELFISDCLLQLRRFVEVLEKCRQVRKLFDGLGAQYEVAHAMLNEACAFTGLDRFEDAIQSLAEAQQIFEEEGNQVAVAGTELQTATILLLQGEPAQTLTKAQECAQIYRDHQLPIWDARANLVAARAALALEQIELAENKARAALTTGDKHHLPDLTYQAYHICGLLNIQRGKPQKGLQAFELAIQDVEQLCGQLMIEFRADFVADKEQVYEDAVMLCLDSEQPVEGLNFAERAKSRALLDLLAHRLDLSLTARSQSDQQIVDELVQLQTQRNQLLRRQESSDRFEWRGQVDSSQDDLAFANIDVLSLEKQITGLWHKLLIRNADYAREAALYQVRTEPIQPYLNAKMILLEYYIAHDKLIAFLVTKETVQAIQLPSDTAQIQKLLQVFWLNLNTVPSSDPQRFRNLIQNVQGILKKLHGLLIAPLNDQMNAYPQVILVPHGLLHYLPFQALYNGENYLLEQHELSYLPGASMLRYCQDAKNASKSLLAIGNSYGGRLPFAVQEARTIAQHWDGHTLLEQQASLRELHQTAAQYQIIHLATHGDFRPDNPLFSGLALADGWLTTLDIFNLRLNASLVTLSACQTGRSVVGGGDELQGLMRAFLAAGAASLVSTLWAVEDQSTADLMKTFYDELATGTAKGAALRNAQLALLAGESTPEKFRHPYYWAPFMLVGDAGPLKGES